jgi:hypothetical protein
LPKFEGLDVEPLRLTGSGDDEGAGLCVTDGHDNPVGDCGYIGYNEEIEIFALAYSFESFEAIKAIDAIEALYTNDRKVLDGME